MNWYKKAKLEDIPEIFQKMFGLWEYKPKTKYTECPKCKQKKAQWREQHPDTDINEMVLHCPDCGYVV